MERLVIDVPETKSSLVRQILSELGVIIQSDKDFNPSLIKEKLLKVSVWSEEDLRAFDDSGVAFEDLKPGKW